MSLSWDDIELERLLEDAAANPRRLPSRLRPEDRAAEAEEEERWGDQRARRQIERERQGYGKARPLTSAECPGVEE